MNIARKAIRTRKGMSMARGIVLAVLCLVLAAASVQARVVKEMEVTRSGKLTLVDDPQGRYYQLSLKNNKLIVLGDPEAFGPATRAALDQAVQESLPVEITGHLLIFNDQNPMYALPVKKIDIKGQHDQTATPQMAPVSEAAQPDAAEVELFKNAKLKYNKAVTVGQAVDNYAFFSGRTWKILEPGKTAEFRGELNMNDYSVLDSKVLERLKSQSLPDTFRSLTLVIPLHIGADGTADSHEPVVEGVFLDGFKERMVWKDPPTYYLERMTKNRKIKIDYFLSRAALNPKYAKSAGSGSGN